MEREGYRRITVQLEGISMTVSVYVNDDMTGEEIEEKAKQEIKDRLLNYWNAYCE